MKKLFNICLAVAIICAGLFAVALTPALAMGTRPTASTYTANGKAPTLVEYNAIVARQSQVRAAFDAAPPEVRAAQGLVVDAVSTWTNEARLAYRARDRAGFDAARGEVMTRAAAVCATLGCWP